MKKIINDPDDFVDEVVDGILRAHGDQLVAASSDRRALVRTDAGRARRVGIVTGGGSGHLPFFLGYVGPGLASGVAIGNVFSSPSPEQILAATLASDGGNGVLFLYGNYGGDVYNFDLAAGMAATSAVETTTVLGTDDILSAPEDRHEARRGVAGLIFAFKTAGAAAERGDDLAAVARVAQRTVDRTRTMGVGIAPTILPAAGEPTFTLDEGEMEIGIGIHGEPGRHRGALEPADAITDRFLDATLAELQLSAGDRVAVLVNGLGATPLEELYLIFRRAHEVLTERGFVIHRSYIGEYATSLEMAGASLSVLHLDAELTELVDAPASSPFFSQGVVSAVADDREDDAASPIARLPEATPPTRIQTSPNPGRYRDVLLALTEKLPAYADELRLLDAALGDGDLGITVSSGAAAVHEAVLALPAAAHPSEVLLAAGAAFAGANPSTYAALMGGGLIAAGRSISSATTFSSTELAGAGRAMLDEIMARGGAELGDKTVVDIIAPVVDVVVAGGIPGEVARMCVRVARDAVDEGAGRVSKRGRAGWLGERSVGQRDPGSVAFLRALECVSDEF